MTKNVSVIRPGENRVLAQDGLTTSHLGQGLAKPPPAQTPGPGAPTVPAAPAMTLKQRAIDHGFGGSVLDVDGGPSPAMT